MNKKAIKLSILAMLVLDLFIFLLWALGCLNSDIDIQGFILSLLITNVIGGVLTYGFMTWD